LTRTEIEQTAAELEAQDPWLAPVFLFALGTGARLKEAVLMTWDRLDLEGGLVRISGDNKTGAPRQVPLGEIARAALESIPTDVRHVEGYVFLNEEGQALTDDKGRNRVSQRTAAAMRRAKVEGASFKATRPTIGTVLAEAGHSDLLIAELLGHAWAKSNVTGRHYIRVHVNHLRPLVAALDGWYLGEELAELDPQLERGDQRGEMAASIGAGE
jgi:integrase